MSRLQTPRASKSIHGYIFHFLDFAKRTVMRLVLLPLCVLGGMLSRYRLSKGLDGIAIVQGFLTTDFVAAVQDSSTRLWTTGSSVFSQGHRIQYVTLSF